MWKFPRFHSTYVCVCVCVRVWTCSSISMRPRRCNDDCSTVSDAYSLLGISWRCNGRFGADVRLPELPRPPLLCSPHTSSLRNRLLTLIFMSVRFSTDFLSIYPHERIFGLDGSCTRSGSPLQLFFCRPRIPWKNTKKSHVLVFPLSLLCIWCFEGVGLVVISSDLRLHNILYILTTSLQTVSFMKSSNQQSARQ